MNIIMNCRDVPSLSGLFEEPAACIRICGRPLLHYLLDSLLCLEPDCIWILEDGEAVTRRLGTSYHSVALQSCTEPPKTEAAVLYVEALGLTTIDLAAAWRRCHKRDFQNLELETEDGVGTGFYFRKDEAAAPESLKVQGVVCHADSIEGLLGCQKLCMQIMASEGRSGAVHTGSGLRQGGACVLSGVSLGDGVTLGDQVCLRDCLVLDGVRIGDRVTAEHCVIGKDAVVEAAVRIHSGAAVGDRAHIGTRTTLGGSASVLAGCCTEPDSCTEEIVHSGTARFTLMDGGISSALRASCALKIGQALAMCFGRIFIGFSPEPCSRALALAAGAGVCSAGADAVLSENALLPETVFASQKSNCRAYLYVSPECTPAFRIGLDGLPLTQEAEAALQDFLGREPVRLPSEFGTMQDGSALGLLWMDRFRKRMPNCREKIQVSADGLHLQQTAQQLFAGGCGSPLVLQLSDCGCRSAFFSDDIGFVTYEQLVLLFCHAQFRKGLDAAVPFWIPSSADQLAAQYKCRILRYGVGADQAARSLAARQGCMQDGLLLAAEVLAFLHESGQTLSEAVQALPSGFLARRLIGTKTNAASLIRKLPAKPQVRFRPSRSGKSLTVYAEARSMEAASELCTECAELIRNFEQKS